METPRLRQRRCLGLHLLGGEDAATLRPGRVAPDAVEVARQLLDGVDRADALDLDGDPAASGVSAHQVDRADVGRPLAALQAQALLERLGACSERFLQVPLDAVLLERSGLAHL